MDRNIQKFCTSGKLCRLVIIFVFLYTLHTKLVEFVLNVSGKFNSAMFTKIFLLTNDVNINSFDGKHLFSVCFLVCDIYNTYIFYLFILQSFFKACLSHSRSRKCHVFLFIYVYSFCNRNNFLNLYIEKKCVYCPYAFCLVGAHVDSRKYYQLSS